MTPIDTRQLKGKPVLVVGATGFIGSHLVRALANLDAQVIAASRSADPTQPSLPNVTWRRCDAVDQQDIASLFREFKPAVTYHLTSETRAQGGRDLSLIVDSIRNDLVATTNVLSEAARSGFGRVVVTGSLEEPDGSARDAVPSSPYAAAKWASSAYARMISALHDLPVTVLRLMMVYGPGQKEHKVIPYTIRTLLAGDQASLASGQRLLDWVYVDDVIDAFLRAGVTAQTFPQSIDIGSGQAVRLRDLLTLVGDLVGRPDLLAFGNRPDPALEREAAANVTDALMKLGWRAQTSMRDGLLRTIAHYAGDARILLPDVNAFTQSGTLLRPSLPETPAELCALSPLGKPQSPKN
jgi:UDP-glucose 4-epimerase